MLKKISICFISQHAYPLFNKNCPATHGGSEVQMHLLGKKLKADGYEVSFIVGNFGQKSVEEYAGINVYKQKLIYSKLMKIKGMWRVQQFQLLSMLKKIKADSYVINGATPDVFHQAYYSFILNSKFVFMTASDVDADGRYKKLFGEESGRYYEKGLQMADLIICQNESQQKTLEEKYHLQSELIRNSIEIPAENPVVYEKKEILWVGSAQPLKQPEIFLELARKFPQHPFTMIMPKHNLELWDKISQETVDIKNLRFIEKVPFEKIGEYYRKAKLFVNTSTYEGFPVTFLQSAIYGAPVLTLNVNPDDFLDKYDCGFCADGNIDYLSQNIKELMENESLWKQKSENVFLYVKENHDIEKNAEIFKKYIHQVVESS